ncbi:MAG: hypothetical protein ABF649_07290 [Bacillus sp. (in: firmicutes)]
MLFGELICKLRGYHKFNYYYSGQCITCGTIRRESKDDASFPEQDNDSPASLDISEQDHHLNDRVK